MTLPYGLFGSREGITSVFDGALGPSSHTERLLTIKGEDGNEVMLRLPLPPHHFFLYRCPVGNAANVRGYQLVISVPRISPEDKAWLRQMIGDLHAGREQEQEESASGVEAVTAVAAATTMGHEEEAEALINQAANLVAELQPNDYLFTTDVKTIATLVYVAAFLSKLVPVTAAFKGKEALQQALWRVVHAPWNSPPSTHVRHVVPPSASQDGRPYLMPMQYIGDRRNAVLEIMVPLSQLPVGSQKMVRDSFWALCGTRWDRRWQRERWCWRAMSDSKVWPSALTIVTPRSLFPLSLPGAVSPDPSGASSSAATFTSWDSTR